MAEPIQQLHFAFAILAASFGLCGTRSAVGTWKKFGSPDAAAFSNAILSCVVLLMTLHVFHASALHHHDNC